jgi:uncharacterized protein (TIGR03032 family)
MNRPFAQLWQRQGRALRDPQEIISCSAASAGLQSDSLRYAVDESFVSLLARLGVTLFVTREYENLVVALHARDGELTQTYLPLAHPSGLVADRASHCLYVAATRNPNQLVELRPFSGLIPRQDAGARRWRKIMTAVREKNYPGCYYFHDLAMIGGQLMANCVGMNGVIRADLGSPFPEQIVWFPKCVQDRAGGPVTTANHIQLNSIAAGPDLRRSFFSASGDKVSARRPGHLNYPVDRRGVIFSGASREVVARGLTRPHSARLHDQKLWVDDSGYGEFGYIADGRFACVAKLPGWTRGLCFVGDVALVGVSRVLPKFRRYAPGIQGTKQRCGIYAVSVQSGAVLGSITWPAGNQIFAIDYLPTATTEGFMQATLVKNARIRTETCFNGIW